MAGNHDSTHDLLNCVLLKPRSSLGGIHMLGIDNLFHSLADQILPTAFGALLSGIGAVVGRLLSHRHNRRLIEALTGFRLSEPPLAIVGAPLRARPGSRELTAQVDALPLFGYGPFVSYAILATRLLRVRPYRAQTLPDIVVSSQYEQLPEQQKRDRDLILLGYPAGNEASRVLEPSMRLPVAFAPNDRRAIVSTDTGAIVAEATYIDGPDSTRRTVHDCGLLVRVRNPLNRERAILYLAGCETFGVKIAADAVTPETIPDIFALGSIAAATWRHRWLPTIGLSRVASADFVAVFSGDVQYLSTGKPILVYASIRSAADGAGWKQTYPTGRAA